MIYADSSALGRAVAVPDRAVGGEQMRTLLEGGDVVSSAVAVTEVLRMTRRLSLPLADGEAVLSRIHLHAPDVQLFRQAGQLVATPDLRSIDALHVVTAQLLLLPSIHTYDRRQARAAASVGLVVLSPGLEDGWYR